VDGEAEYSGRTVDDAIAAAEGALGVSRSDLDIEVLTEGSRGVFGFGAEDARIRARSKVATATATVVSGVTSPEEESVSQDFVEETLPVASGNGAVSTDNLAEDAEAVLRDLLRLMGVQAEVAVRNAESPITLGITGANLGVLIGRRGDNLSALQFMVNLILSKSRRQWPRVVIDVENYRARREDSLRTLADRVAYRVQRNGRAFTLEAMPASDRRIIHLALRDNPGIETYSIGEGSARRVVVAPRRPGNGGQYA